MHLCYGTSSTSGASRGGPSPHGPSPGGRFPGGPSPGGHSPGGHSPGGPSAGGSLPHQIASSGPRVGGEKQMSGIPRGEASTSLTAWSFLEATIFSRSSTSKVKAESGEIIDPSSERGIPSSAAGDISPKSPLACNAYSVHQVAGGRRGSAKDRHAAGVRHAAGGWRRGQAAGQRGARGEPIPASSELAPRSCRRSFHLSERRAAYQRSACGLAHAHL